MIVIELLDHSGQLLARRPADAVPCTIGSARDNTLVLDGDDVAPYHARIDANPDGTLSVTALGIHPGLHRPGAPERQPSLLLTLTAPVAIGAGLLRLVDAAAQAAQPARGALPAEAGTMAPAPPAGWRAWVAQRRVQYAAAMATFVPAAAYGWFTLPTNDRGTTAFSFGVVVMLAVLIWAGFWYALDRSRHGIRRFGSHFVVAAFGTLASLAASEAVAWQEFLLPGSTILAAALVAFTTVVGGLALYAQLRVMGPERKEQHLRWAVGLMAGLVLLGIGADRLDDKWNSEATFTGIIKPWPASMVPTLGAERYGETLTKLEKELDAEAPN